MKQRRPNNVLYLADWRPILRGKPPSDSLIDAKANERQAIRANAERAEAAWNELLERDRLANVTSDTNGD